MRKMSTLAISFFMLLAIFSSTQAATTNTNCDWLESFQAYQSCKADVSEARNTYVADKKKKKKKKDKDKKKDKKRRPAPR